MSASEEAVMVCRGLSATVRICAERVSGVVADARVGGRVGARPAGSDYSAPTSGSEDGVPEWWR